MKKIALISVFDKTGITQFAQKLTELDYDIWSSGGTAKHLTDAGVPVTDIATLVGKPILGHKVVTLSRQIHAGLLCDRKNPHELSEINAEGISPIDLVCCDFYPVQKAIAEGKSTAEVISLTDIGGPTMISSAAKGGRIVVCNVLDREPTLKWIEDGMPESEAFLRVLHAKADLTVSMYRMLSASYHSYNGYQGSFFKAAKVLRYGENPHQGHAALLTPIGENSDPLSVDKFNQLEGAEPSLINITDLSSAVNVLNLVALMLTRNGLWTDDTYLAVVVKHGTPCGFGYAIGDKTKALQNMVAGDPMAAFGGAVVTNFALEEEHAVLLKTFKLLEGQKRIYDLIAVPEIREAAVEMLARKDDKCRIYTNESLLQISEIAMPTAQVEKQVRGGKVTCDVADVLFSFRDDGRIQRIVNSPALHEDGTIVDLCIAHAVCALSKSNTVTLVKDGVLLANASGQQSRVHCAKLAVAKLQEFHPGVRDFVAVSDSFFPVTDGPQVLIDAGVKILFATSGSKMDEKVRELLTAEDVYFMTMPDKDGRLFYGH